MKKEIYRLTENLNFHFIYYDHKNKKVLRVENKEKVVLGHIEWNIDWKQFCYSQYDDAASYMIKSYLLDIVDTIDQLTIDLN